MVSNYLPLVVLMMCGVLRASDPPATRPQSAGAIHLTGRTRQELSSGSGRFAVVETARDLDPKQTALIICDLWDKHWCQGATQRCGEMAARINALASRLRSQGALIVHAPSDTMKFYEGTPQRQLAQNAPMVKTDTIIRWNKADPAIEAPLPIDDSDGGCDDEPQCRNYRAWTREHPAVAVEPPDAVSDSGQEIYNLFTARGIHNIIYCGVHTNMCVLGRSFGIRQMHKLGFSTILVRDLTDTMYNHRMPPCVPHARGTDLMIQHVEKFWCPTILSSDILGDARAINVVIAIGENEYHATDTLTAFAKAELKDKLRCHCTILRSDDPSDLPGVEAIDHADLLILFMRRRSLPPDQLDHFKAYFASGKPVVAIRTSSHAFQNWLDFDHLVLGCHYNNHHAEKSLEAVAAADDAGDPLLHGVGTITSSETLYKLAPLEKSARAVVIGHSGDHPDEPVAITNMQNGGRVFYTSLGAAGDFDDAQFRRLLTNGILWALDRPIP